MNKDKETVYRVKQGLNKRFKINQRWTKKNTNRLEEILVIRLDRQSEKDPEVTKSQVTTSKEPMKIATG